MAMQIDPRPTPAGAAVRARDSHGTGTAACCLVALLTSACSVADNLSYDEIVTELDGIVTITGKGTDRRVVYAETAAVSAWYMRQFWLVPVRWMLGPLLGYRHATTIENPAGHVRDLLRELPDEMGSDIMAVAQATTRLGWIAELDQNGNSRVVALDGLAAAAQALGLELFVDSVEDLGKVSTVEQMEAARAVIAGARPDLRATPRLEDTRLDGYCGALGALVERPLAEWTQRLLLVQDLIELLGGERDERVRPACAAALRAAVEHCVEGVLLRAVQGRDSRFVEVRLCAMELVRRLGGPRSVPLLLAVMSASPEQLARFESRYDPDPLVQLRLIHYCGQLRGSLATTEVRLHGRENWEAIAPVDFLAQAILTEQAYYSKLRTPALAALSLALERPRVEQDATWVREWYRERQRRG